MSDYARIPEANIENFNENYEEKDTELINNKMEKIDRIFKKILNNVMNNKIKYFYIILNLLFNETCDTLYGKTIFHTINNYVFWYFMIIPRMALGIFGLGLQFLLYFAFLLSQTGIFDNNDPGSETLRRPFRYRGDMFGVWRCLGAIRATPGQNMSVE